MKTLTVLSLALSVALWPPTLKAASETLLEGFEEGIENVATLSGRAVLTHFTRTHPDEPGVTQGQSALMVSLANDMLWWAEDFTVTLNPEAAARLKAAWDPDPVTGEKPLARYLLKYDITFPEGGVVAWMNHGMHRNWEPFQEYNSPGNNLAPVTVAIPLDLLPGSLQLNEDETVTFNFINNAQWAEGMGLEPTIIIDNIRLVDQWIGNAPPITTVIESFETGIDIVINPSGRAIVEEYVATGPADENVTHGSRSLKVTLLNEGWASDFTLDLSGSEKLMELLALPPEERERYVFRFDAVFQEMPEGGWGGGNWGYKFGTSAWPGDSARMPSDSATYSFNLGKSNINPDFPTINFYGNGGFADPVVTYFDNFRILDLGEASAVAPEITGVSFDRSSRQMTITWQASAGSTYRVSSSTNLTNWNTVVADNHPTGGATGTTASITIPVNATERAVFFRVSRN
jgi:hypothetical protein